MKLRLIALSICALSVLGCGKKEPRDVTKGGEETMAFIMCQKPVKSSLKSPSSAKFPYAHEQGVFSVHIGDGEYAVKGYVDSQNGFGAQIRTGWTCQIKENVNNTWQLIDLKFDQ
jgi:hypothetical protein